MLLSFIAYLSIFLFVGISVYKAYKFAKMPLRWANGTLSSA